MPAAKTQSVAGAFIISEGLSARESAIVRAFGPMPDGAPLSFSDGEYRPWTDDPSYGDQHLVGLLVGQIDVPESDEGVVVSAVVIVGPAVVDRLRVEHAQWGDEFDTEGGFDVSRSQLWQHLLTRCQIVSEPPWRVREDLRADYDAIYRVDPADVVFANKALEDQPADAISVSIEDDVATLSMKREPDEDDESESHSRSIGQLYPGGTSPDLAPYGHYVLRAMVPNVPGGGDQWIAASATIGSLPSHKVRAMCATAIPRQVAAEALVLQNITAIVFRVPHATPYVLTLTVRIATLDGANWFTAVFTWTPEDGATEIGSGALPEPVVNGSGDMSWDDEFEAVVSTAGGTFAIELVLEGIDVE